MIKGLILGTTVGLSTLLGLKPHAIKDTTQIGYDAVENFKEVIKLPEEHGFNFSIEILEFKLDMKQADWQSGILKSKYKVLLTQVYLFGSVDFYRVKNDESLELIGQINLVPFAGALNVDAEFSIDISNFEATNRIKCTYGIGNDGSFNNSFYFNLDKTIDYPLQRGENIINTAAYFFYTNKGSLVTDISGIYQHRQLIYLEGNFENNELYLGPTNFFQYKHLPTIYSGNFDDNGYKSDSATVYVKDKTNTLIELSEDFKYEENQYFGRKLYLENDNKNIKSYCETGNRSYVSYRTFESHLKKPKENSHYFNAINFGFGITNNILEKNNYILPCRFEVHIYGKANLQAHYDFNVKFDPAIISPYKVKENLGIKDWQEEMEEIEI